MDFQSDPSGRGPAEPTPCAAPLSRVAAVVGAAQTLGAIVAWGGSMLGPGTYERTSSGGFVIGRLDGATDPRLDMLRGLLDPIGAVHITHNLRGARWSKLAINCAI